MILTMTASLCPECLARIPAERRLEGENVYLVKTCPEHGEFRAVLWRGAPQFAEWSRSTRPRGSGTFMPEQLRGCPFDCGLCGEHRQQTCTLLLEVTSRCNLACAFCFANAEAHVARDPDLVTIAELLERAVEQSGRRVNLQLSGGEPTVRDDLPAIISLARSAGFDFIQLNSNGVRLGGDPFYAETLKRAGLSSVFLQFDGVDDAVYVTLRGRALLDEKLRAVEHCARAGLGVVLVPTLVPGVNTTDVGSIIQLALELAPGVRGVHFQPVSYFGRYPGEPDDASRMTLPDLMRAIEEQTSGLMAARDFAPPGCEHPRCSFHGTFLRTADGRLEPLTERGMEQGDVSAKEPDTAAGSAVSFVLRQWAAPMHESCCCASDPFAAFVRSHQERTFSVSAMAFQDVWNMDLERLRECCIHILAPDGRLIPFCAYNVTARDGRTLYRRSPR